MQEKISMPDKARIFMLIKTLPIYYEIVQDEKGWWCCSTDEGIATHGDGSTYEECRRDLVRGMKEIADIYYRHPEYINQRDAVLILHIIKCLCSTEEELISCLAGQN